MSEQPGSRNNQLENKQHFFAIKALIGMGRLAKRRDGEAGKTACTLINLKYIKGLGKNDHLQ